MIRRALMAIVLALVSAPAVDATDDPEARARRIVDQGNYQTELPGIDQESTEGPADRTAVAQRRWRIPVPAGAGTVAAGFAWVLLGALLTAAVVGIGLAVAVSLRRHPAADDGDSGLEGDQVLSPQDRPPDPRSLETMIGEGDWSAAVHALLARAIGRLEKRARLHLPISSTSREILERPEARAHRRQLTVLVAAVEQSRFGGMVLDEGDYTRAREAYDALRSASGGPR